ncbi:hypothetical protein PILCRDRAFT_822583, partial [Piloderma croceum F 1598]
MYLAVLVAGLVGRRIRQVEVQEGLRIRQEFRKAMGTQEVLEEARIQEVQTEGGTRQEDRAEEHNLGYKALVLVVRRHKPLGWGIVEEEHNLSVDDDDGVA